MAYSEDFTQITSGFVNYIGAAMNALPHSTPEAKAQYLVGELMKQSITLSRINGLDNINMYVYKPVLRSVIYVLQQQQEEMKQDLPYTKDIIAYYEQAIISLRKIVDTIKAEAAPT